VIQEVLPLLTEENFFNLTRTEALKLNTNAASIASFVTIPCLLLSGVVYDVLGRKKTIVALLLIGAFSTYGMPLTPPSKAAFIVLRVMF
jgi:MFS family permease